VTGTVGGRVQDLIDRATRETGLDDFGGDSWREGLEVLLRSAETEAHFNDFGEQYFYNFCFQPLVNRLQIEDWYRRHPEIDDQEVTIELLGVGFPRTGSTALSHMLGEDPAVRSLRMWEETTPCPPPGYSEESDRARIAAAEQAVTMGQNYMAERLRSMLPQSPTGPMEDHDLMALEFKAQYFLVTGHLPSYADWFAHCDMEPTYRYEKRVLKLLQWRTPAGPWRLKSPTHTMFLKAYNKVFPEARFVQTHRDVAQVLPSVCDLFHTMLQIGNPEIDPLYIGELNMEQWGLALDRCLEFRTDPAQDARFYDIGFTEFQADPLGTIRSLYSWLGRELAGATAQRIVAWRDENPRDRHGRHEYDGGQFGLTEESLARRFGAYRRSFDRFLA
jgi:hypothetical protein